MFTDFEYHARAEMDERNRRADRLFAESEARRLTTIEGASKGVRFPMPEWLKRAPFVLRTTPR
jgi:hypothetical protein